MEFTFHTQTPGERQRLHHALLDFARVKKIPAKFLNAIDLALEEHLTNIISYGYADDRDHLIKIRFSIARRVLKIEVTDTGKCFDLLAHPEPDLTIPAEKRAIGGLGIHMIKRSMDRLAYARSGRRNTLSMFKKLTD